MFLDTYFKVTADVLMLSSGLTKTYSTNFKTKINLAEWVHC